MLRITILPFLMAPILTAFGQNPGFVISDRVLAFNKETSEFHSLFFNGLVLDENQQFECGATVPSDKTWTDYTVTWGEDSNENGGGTHGNLVDLSFAIKEPYPQLREQTSGGELFNYVDGLAMPVTLKVGGEGSDQRYSFILHTNNLKEREDDTPTNTLAVFDAFETTYAVEGDLVRPEGN